MFDFGFSELVLIALVTLVVVGPERLPKVARTAGHLLGRLQRYVSDVKSDIQREMQIEDLKKLQQQVEEQARSLETSVRSQMTQVESEVGKGVAQVAEAVSVATPAADAAVPISASASGENVGPSVPSPQLELGLDRAVATRIPVDKT